jgi:pimeloyl-ACP methyl ester carboxylesterase
MIHYRYAAVDGHNIFYREAGPNDAATVLLLHGFPTSSHMFRKPDSRAGGKGPRGCA